MGWKKNKEYYAVISGRLDEPTIFTSWGDVHPRVTSCKSAMYQGFHSIEEARDHMKENRVSEYKEVIKQTALGTTPAKKLQGYYAVAHGANPGIRPVWYGKGGTLENVHEVEGACHKHFRTEAQAIAFIEDWKEAFADVVRRAVKKELDRGLRPRDMKLNMEGLLHDGQAEDDTENLAEQLSTGLQLDEK